MHFGLKQNAFCRKTGSILPQNGMHFAAKRNAFCGKMEIETNENLRKRP